MKRNQKDTDLKKKNNNQKKYESNYSVLMKR